MSLYSMTGFAKSEQEGEDFTVSLEIKSVNHRFRDIRLKIPSIFSAVEHLLRKEIEKSFKRGSFDIHISYKRKEGKNNFSDIDDQKVISFLEKTIPLLKQADITPMLRPTDLLRSEFMADDNNTMAAELHQLAPKAMKDACERLKEARAQEGSSLRVTLQEHCKHYQSEFAKIGPHAKEYETYIKEKLSKRFEEVKDEIKLDESRFGQEVIYYLEKLDISEELDRIKIHLEKLNSLLEQGGETGRQIDFMVQELNRETNTIGSKSGVSEISEAVVQMKVYLEKIREQALNIE